MVEVADGGGDVKFGPYHARSCCTYLIITCKSNNRWYLLHLCKYLKSHLFGNI